MDCHVITPQTDIACQIVFSHCHTSKRVQVGGKAIFSRGGFSPFFGNDFLLQFQLWHGFFAFLQISENIESTIFVTTRQIARSGFQCFFQLYRVEPLLLKAEKKREEKNNH